MTVDGIDQSWGYADPAKAKAAGIRVVAMYLSHDLSKNATAAKVKAYHAVGIAVLLNWESQPGRPLLGASAGAEDGHDAVAMTDQLIREVGYQPSNKLAIPFSCDTDTNTSQYPAIDAYYSATRSALGDRYINGVYGEASLVHHLHAKGLTQMEWQTLAWSGGVIDPEADFYQSSINNTLGGASVDFDRIIHEEQLGAWWPPGHSLDLNAGQLLNAKDSDVSALIVRNLDENDLPVLNLGGKSVPLRGRHSAGNLAKAGVPVAEVDGSDYWPIRKL